MGSGTAFFPDGPTGAGLLLLRFSVGMSVLVLAARLTPGSYVSPVIGVVVAVGLCAGLQTRVLAALSLLAPALGLIMATASPELIAVHTLSAAALTLTGAGAFSADSVLFGRRTITLPDRDDSIE